MPHLVVIEAGRRPYGEVLDAQRALVAQRPAGRGEDTLILCEHPPVYTRGVRTLDADVARANGTPVYTVRRGGGATYHGPGQLVGYPVLRLRDWGWRVSEYMRVLEDVLMGTLDTFGVMAQRVDCAPGVWVGSRKIASIGIQVSRGVTWHGFALNVSCDLAAFRRIIACREPEIQQTSLSHELGSTVAVERVQQALIHQWSTRTHRALVHRRYQIPVVDHCGVA